MSNSKEILAKLLASENISVQHRNVDTAYFNLVQRILVLPMWKKDLSDDVYDLLIGHEVGHALYTPQDEWTSRIEMNRAPHAYYNIVEDARIEVNIKKKYPGLRKNFYRGYKELKDSEHFGHLMTVNVQDRNLIDRINIFYKLGLFVSVPFTDEERVFLTRIDASRSFSTVCKIVEDIYKHSKDKQEEQQSQTSTDNMMTSSETDEDKGEKDSKNEKEDKQETDGKSGEESADSDGDDGSSELDGDSSVMGKDDDDSSMSGNGDDDDSNDGNSDLDTNSTADSTDGVGNKDADCNNEYSGNYSDIDSMTDHAWDAASKSFADETAMENEYLIFNTYDYKPIHEDYKVVWEYLRKHIVKNTQSDEGQTDYNTWISRGKDDLELFKRESMKTIAHMAQTFEMKKSADAYKRRREGKTGVLNPIKLHAYKYEENIFKKSMTVTDGKNHGLVFFIDWSTSMYSVIHNTMKQLFTLIMFCKKVNIPFEVYAFSNKNLFDESRQPLVADLCIDPVQGGLGIDPNFKLMNILSSRMSIKDYTFAVEYLLTWSRHPGSRFSPGKFRMAGTPLQAAITASENLIKDFQRINNLQIVNVIFLSDGDSNYDIGTLASYTPPHQPSRTLWINRQEHSTSKNTIVVDNKTKKEYKHSDYCGGQSHRWCSILLGILSDRTKCNVIGFNITTHAPRWVAESTGQTTAEIQKSMRKNKFFGTTATGYTDYYLLSAKNMYDLVGELKVDKEMSTRKAKTEFIKHNLAKKTNKILLNRFIEQII